MLNLFPNAPSSPRPVMRVPLRAVLAGALILQTGVAVILTGWLAWQDHQRRVIGLTDQVEQQASQQILLKLDGYLSAPHQVNQINGETIRQQWIDSRDLDRWESHLLHQLRIFDSVSYIQWGNQWGEFVGAGIAYQQDSPVIERADQSTDQHLYMYQVDVNASDLTLAVASKQFLQDHGPYDPRQRPWYQRAVTDQEAGWSPIYQAYGHELLVIDATLPVYDPQQDLIGVLGTTIWLTELDRFLQDLVQSSSGQGFIVDREGFLVARSSPEPIQRIEPSSDPEDPEDPKTSEVLEPGSSLIPAKQSQDPLIQAVAHSLYQEFEDLNQIDAHHQLDLQIQQVSYAIQVEPFQDQYGLNWLVILAFPLTELNHPLRAHGQSMLILTGTVLLLATVAGWLTARSIARPLQRLSVAVVNSTQTDPNFQFPEQTPLREVALLIQSFNSMQQRLHQSLRDLEQTNQALEARVEERTALLARQEALYREVVEFQTDLICRSHPDTTILFVNSAYSDFFQAASPDQFIGQKRIDLVPVDQRDQVWSRIDRLSPAQPTNRMECYYPATLGCDHWVIWIDRGIFNPAGDLIEIQSVGWDITEIRHAEAALRASEERFRAIFAQTAMGITRTSLDGHFWEVNPAFCALTGYSAAELLSRTVEEITDPSDWEQERLMIEHQFQDRLDTFTLEKRLVSKSGKILWVSVCTTLVRDLQEAPQFLVSVVQNISPRKHFEAALKARIDHEQTLNQIGQAIRCSLELDNIFATATQALGQLFQADHVEIYRYQPNQNTWHQEASFPSDAPTNRSDPNDLAKLEIPAITPEISDQLQHLQVVQIEGNRWVQIQNSCSCTESLYASWLLIPLQSRAVSCWGAISLIRYSHPDLDPVSHSSVPAQNSQESRWNPDEIELAYGVADQLALAIEQSELYQQVQHLNQELEAQVQDRTTQLEQALAFESLLRRISDRVRDSLDEDQILQVVARELALGLNLGACKVYLPDRRDDSYRVCYEQAGLDQPVGHGISLPACPNDLNHLEQGELLFYAETDQNQGPLEILWCPIRDDQTVLGLLNLIRPAPNGFGDLECRLAEQVANQCGIAIRQARLHQAAQHQVYELERLNQLKDDFLSTVSHELRTPLTNMKMAIQMLQMSEASSPFHPKQKQYINLLDQECKREVDLINDLLDLQRLEATQIRLNLESIDLNLWLQTWINHYQATAQARQLCLDLDPCHLESLPHVKLDRLVLDRILRELLTNACKYTPQGGQIRVKAGFFPSNWNHADPPAQQQGRLILIISNTATIAKEEFPRLFERFYRIQQADRWQQGGTGLGLALIKEWIDHLQGSIQVSSDQGWTHFTVVLPTEAIPAEEISLEGIQPEAFAE